MLKRNVVKVGGSLMQWPGLAPALRSFVTSQDHATWLIVPGGGMAADIVRQWDRVHRLGEESSHWLALAAMKLNGEFLIRLLDESRSGEPIPQPKCEYHILDPLVFFRDDEHNVDRVPLSWMTTSDALAARVAEALAADELVLLKSAAPPNGSIEDWANAGYVDLVFPTIVQRSAIKVTCINLLAWPLGQRIPC